MLAAASVLSTPLFSITTSSMEVKLPRRSSTKKEVLPVLPVWCMLPVMITLRTSLFFVRAARTMLDDPSCVRIKRKEERWRGARIGGLGDEERG